MKRKKRYLMIMLICSSIGLSISSSSYAWNPFTFVKNAIGTVVNTLGTVTGSVVSVVGTVVGGTVTVVGNVVAGIGGVTQNVLNTAGDVLKGLGVVGSNTIQSTISAIYQNVATSEPGAYSFSEAITNLIAPSNVKLDNPITYKDNLAGYALPKVDLQVKKNLPFQWQKVQLSKAETGASCFDGSDYKFFVNLTPTSKNFVIFLEPGGACFDAESCSAESIKTDKLDPNKPDLDQNGNYQYKSERGISNPKGVSDTYPSLLQALENLKAPERGSYISPVVSRISLLEGDRTRVQNWNYIYLPYCSGDIHVGDVIRTLTNEKDGKSVTAYFNGTNNIISALGWMRNNMPKPTQVYLTGQSAGSAAVDIHRATVRHFLNPEQLFTLADSGFAVPEDPSKLNKNLELYPAALMREKMRKVWLNYKPDDIGNEKKPLSLLKAIIPKLEISNTNNLSMLINEQYPDDRMTYVNSLNDLNFSGYSYQYNPGFIQAAIADGDANIRKPHSFSSNLAQYSISEWAKDLDWLKSQVDRQNSNIGYYMPSGRRFNESHCLTAFNYDGVINDDTKTRMIDVINNLTDLNRPKVIRERQENNKFSGINAELSQSHKLLHKVMPEIFPSP